MKGAGSINKTDTYLFHYKDAGFRVGLVPTTLMRWGIKGPEFYIETDNRGNRCRFFLKTAPSYLKRKVPVFTV